MVFCGLCSYLDRLRYYRGRGCGVEVLSCWNVCAVVGGYWLRMVQCKIRMVTGSGWVGGCCVDEVCDYVGQ